MMIKMNPKKVIISKIEEFYFLRKDRIKAILDHVKDKFDHHATLGNYQEFLEIMTDAYCNLLPGEWEHDSKYTELMEEYEKVLEMKIE